MNFPLKIKLFFTGIPAKGQPANYPIKGQVKLQSTCLPEKRNRMIFVSGPYSSTNPDEKKARVKAIASACIKIMQSGDMAISPLTFGLSLIEKSEQSLPDSYEFWDRFCREFVKTADELWVLALDGYDSSSGVKDEIEAAKERKIPVKLVHPSSLILLEYLYSPLGEYGK